MDFFLPKIKNMLFSDMGLTFSSSVRMLPTRPKLLTRPSAGLVWYDRNKGTRSGPEPGTRTLDWERGPRWWTRRRRAAPSRQTAMACAAHETTGTALRPTPPLRAAGGCLPPCRLPRHPACPLVPRSTTPSPPGTGKGRGAQRQGSRMAITLTRASNLDRHAPLHLSSTVNRLIPMSNQIITALGLLLGFLIRR